MPALTNSRLGSSSSSDALGHDGVAALAEERQPPPLDLGGLHQRALLVGLGWAGAGSRGGRSGRRPRPGESGCVVAGVHAQRLAQLGLALGHAGAHLVGEGAHAPPEAARPARRGRPGCTRAGSSAPCGRRRPRRPPRRRPRTAAASSRPSAAVAARAAACSARVWSATLRRVRRAAAGRPARCARRSVKAATLTTGPPRVAANSAVRAETLVVTACTLRGDRVDPDQLGVGRGHRGGDLAEQRDGLVGDALDHAAGLVEHAAELDQRDRQDAHQQHERHGRDEPRDRLRPTCAPTLSRGPRSPSHRVLPPRRLRTTAARRPGAGVRPRSCTRRCRPPDAHARAIVHSTAARSHSLADGSPQRSHRRPTAGSSDACETPAARCGPPTCSALGVTPRTSCAARAGAGPLPRRRTCPRSTEPTSAPADRSTRPQLVPPGGAVGGWAAAICSARSSWTVAAAAGHDRSTS